MTRVLVAAPSAVVRAGLEALVASSPRLTVVGQVASIEMAARANDTLQPEVVLVEHEWDDDLLVPGLLAFDAGSHIPAVVVLTEHPGALWAAVALRSRVRAVLPRDATAAEIIAAVEGAAAGLVVLHPDTAEAALASLAAVPIAADAPAQLLTPREIEVLHMLAEGLGNKTVARRLGISEHTVKFHVGSIFSKLHVASRTEAVTVGVRQGLVML
ncbi:MAG: response regulator transcription factor [Thermomicrobia bacterium]|nr:response regulator transcription factor [Thermomicrobia bacterium]MCA1724573.1 response regulator transcription factor [Thermomicrobia bacterium]